MKKAIIFFAIIFTYRVSMTQERISSYPFIAGDTFRKIADHIIDETQQHFDPAVLKARDIIFLKTDYVPRFFSEIHPRIKVEYILITHNADFSPIYLKTMDHAWIGHDFTQYLEDPQLVVWFAQNIDYKHQKLQPLPIGISNNYNHHGRVELFFNAVRNVPPFDERCNQIYLNFTTSTNIRERQSALDFFRDKPYAHIAGQKSPQTFLEDLKRFKYVLCPEGNGIDCHRTWEALLMGCVPILKHSMIDKLFEGLPVILVNDWSEVTEDLLNRYEQDRIHAKYKMERAYADYWIALIRSYKQS